MAKVKVPLSHRPAPELVEVDRDEIPGLVTQGLLAPDDVPPEEEAPPATQAAASATDETTPGRAKTKPSDPQGA